VYQAGNHVSLLQSQMKDAAFTLHKAVIFQLLQSKPILASQSAATYIHRQDKTEFIQSYLAFQ